MGPIKVGDKVVHIKKPWRGEAVVRELKDGMATLFYERFNLSVKGVRVRDMEVRP